MKHIQTHKALHYITLNLKWKNAEALQTLYKHVNNSKTGKVRRE